MRHAITALAAAALIAALAGPTLAFDSGGTPTDAGADSIAWTGNGATSGVLDETICAPDARARAYPYLHWILTTDGGSLDTTAALPVLDLTGGVVGSYTAEEKGSKAVHFYTPYTTPDATLEAEAFFTVLTTGTGSWILTISHGCAPDEGGAADLTVEASASTSFTRTYDWTIAKSVDRTRVAQFGGTATFNYEVDAGQTGVTDGDWLVTGTIVVHNPNDAAVALTGVSVVVDDGGVCTVSGSSTQSIPADGDSDGLGFTCTYAAAPDPLAGSATVTATWDGSAAGTPTGTADATAAFTFGDPTSRVNDSVTITDSVEGTLGTLTASESEPYATATYMYSRTIDVPTWDCMSYDNTATIEETGQSDGQSVQVCGPAKTGALTIGFWQNRNGQAIVTGGASSAGVCNSGTWLRGYAPFADLSPTASCSQVASYVASVVKAANASGASMNAMLKAQMLATGLDVYFSDPSLGGNRIGAAEPIGGVSVDLTVICTDLGCTQFEDSSSVFGGSPKTILEMLAAASAAYQTTGWYDGNKATQELAKDAFDALNNQKVFGF